MGRSQESFNKKEVRSRKEKKRKEKEKKRLARKDSEKKSSLDDMIAYVDADGNITSVPPDPSKTEEIKLEDIEVSVPQREDVPLDPIRKGVVTFFNESKGFGFIRDLETNESVFVHVNDILEAISEGDRVSFELTKGQKGPAAIQVSQYKEQ
jgi:cold shock CspA family protein